MFRHSVFVLLGFTAVLDVLGQGIGPKRELLSDHGIQAADTSSVAPGEKAFTDWVRSHAIALKTVEAGHGFDDMQKLSDVVGDARIVALGEATHGTHEFFQLKHRIVECLASQKGFTIFSIEANMPEAYRLNDYVLHGNGDAKELLKGMYFWTWNTQEVLTMVEWMRQFNESGKGRIEFTGFDMQYPSVPLDIVRKFVPANDGEYFSKLEPAFQDVVRMTREPVLMSHNGRRDTDRMFQLSALEQECKESIAHLEQSRDFYLSQGSTNRDIDWAVHNAQLVLQYVQLRAGSKSRDESMAENVKWIADHNPKGKIILWAHNGHATRGANFDYQPMGKYLTSWFGKQYVNFGFAFNDGSFRAVETGKGLHEFSVDAPPEGTLDRALADSDIPVFALDLRQLPSQGAVADWMGEPHDARSIGAVYSEHSANNYFARMKVQESYDALLFVKKTTAARGN